MDKKTWRLGVYCGLLGLAIGGLAVRAVMMPVPVYVPPLKVVGDVRHSLALKKIDQVAYPAGITFQGTRYRAIRLAEVINMAGPIGKTDKLYLISGDGFTSAIGADDIADCYISYTAKNGWESVNLSHPVSSNAKSLQEIVVVSDGSDSNFGLSVINMDTDLARVTPGQMLTHNLLGYFYHEGDASVRHDGQTYESGVYTLRQVFRLGDLVPAGGSDHVLVMGENGSCRLLDSRGYFEVKDNYFNYLLPDERIAIEKVKGVVVDPPTASITDTYFDAQHWLENGEPVLVVALDGFTYRQYAYAVANGSAPFLKRAGPAVKAVGVYPLADNVGFAAMITGESPENNGIVTAKDQKLQAPSIFAEVLRIKKQALLLETDRSPLYPGAQPVLATDKNGNGTADDELYAMALDNIGKGYALMVVRFSGIADSGERYGALSDQAMESVRATDKYIEGIADRWSGRVIIAAGQGNGSGNLPGSQSGFGSDTMFVPYRLIDKK